MTEQNPFAPAVREQLKLRMAIDGVSGSGKTMTAMKIASAMVPSERRDNGLAHIAFIDTERDSARKYAQTPGIAEFDVMQPKRNNNGHVHPQTFIDAVKAAAQYGYEYLIVDSFSHAWLGMLDMKNTIDARGGNSFANWGKVNPLLEQLVNSLLEYPGHVIVTMRSKTKHVIVENENGRAAPQKVGLDSIMRDGIEYEFDIILTMDGTNTGTISKTRCYTLQDETFYRPGADLANIIASWLQDGDARMSKPDFIAACIELGLEQSSIGAFLQEHDILLEDGIDRYERMLEAVKVVLASQNTEGNDTEDNAA